MYRLLARLWIGEVDEGLLTTMRHPDFAARLAEVSGDDLDVASVSLAELEEDYCQLFIGPANHLPPYQSVWRSGRFEGDATESMRRIVEAARYSRLHDGPMADHLGVQLDLMSHLLETRASDNGFSPEQLQALAEMTAFAFHSHVAWVLAAPLLALAEAKAATSFYRAVLRLTRDFIASERDEFSKNATFACAENSTRS